MNIYNTMGHIGSNHKQMIVYQYMQAAIAFLMFISNIFLNNLKYSMDFRFIIMIVLSGGVEHNCCAPEAYYDSIKWYTHRKSPRYYKNIDMCTSRFGIKYIARLKPCLRYYSTYFSNQIVRYCTFKSFHSKVFLNFIEIIPDEI